MGTSVELQASEFVIDIMNPNNDAALIGADVVNDKKFSLSWGIIGPQLLENVLEIPCFTDVLNAWKTTSCGNFYHSRKQGGHRTETWKKPDWTALTTCHHRFCTGATLTVPGRSHHVFPLEGSDRAMSGTLDSGPQKVIFCDKGYPRGLVLDGQAVGQSR